LSPGSPTDERARCAADFPHFTDTYAVIDEVLDDGTPGAMVPFRLWPDQVPVAHALQAERRVIILKARQLGITWLCCAYVLWLCLFHAGRVVLLFSQGEVEAAELLRRVKVLYTRLPERFRALLPAVVRDNVSELGWAHGSRVRSLPATQKAGRSFTASLVVMDEAAHMAWGGLLYTAVKPTIDGGGQLIVLSTANGFDDFFHAIWTRARAGQNSFKALFLPWWSRPGRDQAWYDRVVAESVDPDLVKQEYPSNDVESFRSSGRVRFPADWVSAQAANVAEPWPRHLWSPALRNRPGWRGMRSEDAPMDLGLVPGMRIYKEPQQYRRYILAADVAEGKEPKSGRDPDWDAAVLLDDESWEEMASLHGRWEPDEYSRYLMALAEPYQATIVVERNNHGHSVLSNFRLRHFPRIGLGADGYEGWLTDVRSKPQGDDFLAECLRDGRIAVRTAAALGEFQVYSVLKNGKVGAAPGHHDDWVSAWRVALSYLRQRSNVGVNRTASVFPNPLAGYRG
jgi:hypothetical protein